MREAEKNNSSLFRIGIKEQTTRFRISLHCHSFDLKIGCGIEVFKKRHLTEESGLLLLPGFKRVGIDFKK